MIYVKYLISLLRHKWFVFLESCRLGIPWLGVVHDWTKFLPVEFIPYAQKFYGSKKDTPAWQRAWLHHENSNKHHPEYWTLRGRLGMEPLPIPNRYRREMLADWIGAGRAYGKQPQNNNDPDTRAWYLTNRDKITLHPETRAWLEAQLGL